MIRGITFVTVPVTDQDRALAFYTEKLGFRIATDQPFDGSQRWIELSINGADTRLVLFRQPGGIEPGAKMNLSFWTDDIDSTARQMKKNGVEVSEPQKKEWGTFLTFQDPDGNSFVLSSK